MYLLLIRVIRVIKIWQTSRRTPLMLIRILVLPVDGWIVIIMLVIDGRSALMIDRRRRWTRLRNIGGCNEWIRAHLNVITNLRVTGRVVCVPNAFLTRSMSFDH